MEMSAKSGLSLGFRYLVFSLLFENKKLLSILINIWCYSVDLQSQESSALSFSSWSLLFLLSLSRSSTWKSPTVHCISSHRDTPSLLKIHLDENQWCRLTFVSVYCLFLFRSFQVQPLAPHMRPIRKRVLTDAGNSSGSPFIFSTLRQNRKEARKVKRKQWLRKTSVLLWYLGTVWHKLQMNVLILIFLSSFRCKMGVWRHWAGFSWCV